MAGINYRDLAMRIRRAHDVAAARDNPHLLAEGGVRIADVLDLLTSEKGAALEQELEREAKSAVADVRTKLAQAGEPSTMSATLNGADVEQFLPADPFRKELARFFDGYLIGATAPDAIAQLVPQAVVETLAHVAGSGGVLTDDVALARLGPVGLRVLQKCRALLHDGVPTSERPDTKLEDVSPVASEALMRGRAHDDPLKRMPVLDELTRMMGGPDALKGMRMAAVQHLFPSTEGLFDALKKNGLAPQNVIVGGKGYSTDAETSVRLQAKGYGVHFMGRAVAHAGQNAEDIVAMMARDELKTLFAGVDPKRVTGRPFLLLDEGGKLVKLLHEEFPQYAHLCVAVEQTDRGIQVLEEMQRHGVTLQCPVVNMARSEAKKVWESPMIGESCVHNVDLDLQELGVDVTPKEAAVIGYGAVGKAIADRLRARGYTVHVYDIDDAAMARAKADGCVIGTRDDALEHGHLLYGCTGRGAITEDDYEKLPDGAVLANAASGNHELGHAAMQIERDDRVHVERDRARRVFGGKDVDLGDAGSPMRHGVVRTKSGKELLLMRSGYVCNMGRDIPPEVVQLIRGLLLASVLQAAKETRTGLVDVDGAAQQFLVARVNKLLASFDTSLAAPDFRAFS